MEWFDTNFVSFLNADDDIQNQGWTSGAYVFWGQLFHKVKKQWRLKIQFFRNVHGFFWNEFRRRNGLFSPLLESRRFTFKTNPDWENLNFSKNLETSHSTCRKALWREYCEIYTDPKVPRQSRLAHETLFKTLHCTSNLSLTWSVKGLSKTWVNVANSYFGAKKSQNQVFTWYKNTGSFSLAFAQETGSSGGKLRSVILVWISRQTPRSSLDTKTCGKDVKNLKMKSWRDRAKNDTIPLFKNL